MRPLPWSFPSEQSLLLLECVLSHIDDRAGEMLRCSVYAIYAHQMVDIRRLMPLKGGGRTSFAYRVDEIC